MLIASLALVAVVSLLVVFHNYGHPILPRKHLPISPAQLTPYSAERAHVMILPFDHSEPNRPGVDRSAVILLENGVPYSNAHRDPAELMQVGGRRWVHEPGRILFASPDNSDPRANGRVYTVLSPVLYTRGVAHAATLAFVLATAGLYWLVRRQPAPAGGTAQPSRWRWHLAGTALLFLGGLYCNTGTLTPYAITTFPHVAKGTGYLYNPDHAHFRALADFVEGRESSRWDGAILLRRILYPVLAWPFMKLAGFEVGGTVASLALNVAALLWCAHLIRRRIGERGAVFALWLLAVYPGAAYWAGLPYPYALISPLSLLLLIGLHDLAGATGWRLAGLSLAMGVAYLAYDFTAFFLPATLLLLCWHRRFGAAIVACAGQILPLAAWVLILAKVFHQPLSNSNSATYQTILTAYSQAMSPAQLWAQLASLPETGLAVLFGANFLFLPGLFLLLAAINPLTSRVRLTAAETALLLAMLAIFLFNHFAPAYGGWQMRGTWISRIYQPVFPVFILFAARWWQHLPPLRPPARVLFGTALAAALAGNALIVFGPILKNPLRVSETAYYRFYNHNDNHWVYTEHCLAHYGRHPLGFPAPRR
jgi:hypothetical protein